MEKSIKFSNNFFAKEWKVKFGEEVAIKTERSSFSVVYVHNGWQLYEKGSGNFLELEADSEGLMIRERSKNVNRQRQTKAPKVKKWKDASSTACFETAINCKICLSEPVTVTFIPCGHTVSCESCAEKLNNSKCVICRETIEKKIKIYF